MIFVLSKRVNKLDGPIKIIDVVDIKLQERGLKIDKERERQLFGRRGITPIDSGRERGERERERASVLFCRRGSTPIDSWPYAGSVGV